MIDKWIIQKEISKKDFELDTKLILIYGKPRQGKTLLASVIVYDEYEERAYCNFNVYKDGVSINKRFETYQDLKNINFSQMHGVVAFDEWSIWLNSKDWFSEGNRQTAEFLFLSWKKNCDFILLSQRGDGVDINFRMMAKAIFKVEKIQRYWRKPLFKVTRQFMYKNELKDMFSFEIDTLTIMKKWWITYDTLDESRVKDVKKELKKQKEELKEAKKEGFV